MARKIIQMVILVSGVLGGGIFNWSFAEDALRDGNRNPTLLFDQNGSPKRVSNTSPLPVSGNLSIPTGNPIPVMAPAAIPITSTETLKVTAPTPLAVTAAAAFPIVSSQTLNVSVSNPLPVQETGTVTVRALNPFPVTASGTFPIVSTNTLNVSVPTPLPVSLGAQTSTITVRIGDQANPVSVMATNPLPVSLQNQANPVTVLVGNQVTPVPVNIVDPSPVTTTTRELTGTISQTLITPSAGKRLVVKGCALILSKSGAIGTLRFQGGQLVSRVVKIEHSGTFIPINLSGAINEPLVVDQTGAGGADTCFFIVNTVEQ